VTHWENMKKDYFIVQNQRFTNQPKNLMGRLKQADALAKMAVSAVIEIASDICYLGKVMSTQLPGYVQTQREGVKPSALNHYHSQRENTTQKGGQN
jgi:hypothetical protein